MTGIVTTRSCLSIISMATSIYVHWEESCRHTHTYTHINIPMESCTNTYNDKSDVSYNPPAPLPLHCINKV